MVNRYTIKAAKIFNRQIHVYNMYYFTINDANLILPDVIKKYEWTLKKQNEVSKLEKQLQMVLSTTDSFEEYVPLKQKLNTAITQFYEASEILEKTGVMIKSIEQGLLDFPSKRFEEDVWLCWKYGETEIKFWHEQDSGYMGRKPVDVSDESLV